MGQLVALRCTPPSGIVRVDQAIGVGGLTRYLVGGVWRFSDHLRPATPEELAAHQLGEGGL